MAIREDESVAEVMGINTVNSKLMAFVVGAVLASFSGAVLAAKVGSVFPKSFESYHCWSGRSSRYFGESIIPRGGRSRSIRPPSSIC